MAASQAVASYGATITINGTDIAEVGDISGLDLSTDLDEVTHHGSPDGVEERIPTIKRLGELSFPMNVVSADQGQQDLFVAGRSGSGKRGVAVGGYCGDIGLNSPQVETSDR
jgi:hypothetical protein